MKREILASAAALAFMAGGGLAHAGTFGAGPAGTGSLIVGATVVPPTMTDALVRTPEPGKIGKIQLKPEQARAIAAYLTEQAGGTVSGSLITASTTFADGTEGVLTLDTDSSTLTLKRA